MKILILEGLHGNNKGKKMQWRLKRTNLKVGNGVTLNNHDWKIVKVIGEKKRNIKRSGIGWDLGTEDESCMVGYRIDIDGNVKIENIEYLPKKEVKKVRQYFEMKVVKVKKKKKEWTPDRCPCCGAKREAEKPLTDNWVNGENLDKIKFPVPCSYVDPNDNKKHIGMLNCYVNWYRLYNIEEQSKDNFVDDCTSLKNLIKDYDIHILKGKIIIYENI